MVILIQNVVNVFFYIANFAFYTIKMSAQEYVSEVEKLFCLVSHFDEFAEQVAAVVLTRHLSRHSIDLNGIVIHMHSNCSVVRCFLFTVSKEQPSFTAKEYK